MTTTVRVVTHDWPVQVTHFDKDLAGEWIDTADVFVDPHSEHSTHVHASHKIEIVELSKDAKNPNAAATEHTNLKDGEV